MTLFFHTLPIKTKLALKFGFFVAIILVLVGGTTFFVFRQRILSDTQDLILLQYENITNTILAIEEENPEDRIQDQTNQSIEEATNLGLLTFIFDKNGVTLESPTYVEDYIPKSQSGFFLHTITNQNYIFYAGNYQGLYVVIGKNLGETYAGLDSLFRILIFIGLLSIILAFGIGYIFSREALRSLSILIDDISTIHPERDSDLKLLKNYTKDEIGILADTFNSLLDRIHTAIQREKEFTQDVSHELRTPLMVLSTSLELLERKISDISGQEKIKNMQKTIGNMNELIDELLFLARKTNQKNTENLNIGEFLKNYITEQFSFIAAEKNIVISYNIPKDFNISTQSLFLQKVFGNLIKNSILYTDAGGEIEVTISNKKVSIKDTGKGMSEIEISHIWDRFYRADSSRTKNQVSGYGLGLAIVKKVVDEQNWKILVDSKKGKGTTFEILF